MAARVIAWGAVITLVSRIAFAGSGCDGTEPIPFEQGGRWGYMTRDGRMLVPAKLDAAWAASEGIAIAAGDGEFVFFTKAGAVSARVDYKETSDFHEELVTASDGRLWGFLNASGEVKIGFQFVNRPCDFSQGLACVSMEGKWGYIDRGGKFVIEPKFDSAESFADGFALVTENGRACFIDRAGDVRLNEAYDAGLSFSEGIGAVRKDGCWRYITSDGKRAFEGCFDECRMFSEGRAAVRVGKLWGYVDRSGTFAVAPRFDAAGEFSEGRAAVALGNRFGFIDGAGELAIPLSFDDVGRFCGGVAEAWESGKLVYVRPDGSIVGMPGQSPSQYTQPAAHERSTGVSASGNSHPK